MTGPVKASTIVVEVGGPGTLAQSIDAVRIGGHIHLIGVLTGFAGDVPTATLMSKQARLQGLIVGSRRMQMELVRALDEAAFRPVIDRCFALDQLAMLSPSGKGRAFRQDCRTF